MRANPESARSRQPLRALVLISALIFSIGAHCPPPSDWGPGPKPQPGAPSQVYLDSGVVVRLDLLSDEAVTGRLLMTVTPRSRSFVVCPREKVCGSPDAPDTRRVEISTLRQLRIPRKGTDKGAHLGSQVGVLAGLLAAEDDEDYGPALLGLLGGTLIGGAIGSRFTNWITVAKREEGRRLTWMPTSPVFIPAPPAEQILVTECAVRDSLPGTIVAFAFGTDRAYHTELARVWNVDTSDGRLHTRSATGVRCRNQAWRGPTLSASREAEADALTFRPSTGNARIYVYHTNRLYGSDESSFVILLDGESVGRTVNGTYLMLEVDPGPHSISVRGESTSAVSVTAEAQRSYFLRLWHKTLGLSLSRTGFGGLELMNPEEGRKTVTAGHMMPLVTSAW